MKLIPEARKAWRMFSVQAQAITIAVLGGWQMLPEELKAHIPSRLVFSIAIVLLVGGIIGRLFVQPKVSGK